LKNEKFLENVSFIFTISNYPLSLAIHFRLSFKGGVLMKESKSSNKMKLRVNRKDYTLTVNSDTPLLWVLRENLGLTGTKYGCGISLCGACTVLVNGEAIRSCVTPVGSMAGKEITTIEGLSPDGTHPLQKAWVEDDVPQCGYCHSGQILSAAALLAKNSTPSDADIDEAMAGNICRCGTYQRIRHAIHRAARIMAEGGKK
jgi:aerobic-type carbon monoxide dehydrogenase small subunit (CoxS/CutS family)